MRRRSFLIFLGLSFASLSAFADRAPTTKPADPFFAKFDPRPTPAPSGLLLKTGDRLAIVGDSITEQKLYSRMMETYLTVCVPELEITARQYGWSGETAEGFLRRMKDDCLRFSPTIATTCYGMNDHRYRPYDEANGQWYRANQSAIVDAFQQAGARVVLGSPGCVGKMPSWVKTATGTVEDLNLNLCQLRNIDIEIAGQKKAAFADVFWPMFTAGFAARQQHGPDFCVEGKDGVHPGWAGQTVMAYAFLKAMGVSGDIGTISIDLGTNEATASAGHKVFGFEDNELKIESHRYPYCAPAGDPAQDNNIRAGMALVPFNEDLNRFVLVAKGGKAASYKVTWGNETRSYSAEALGRGINLAADFAVNPFSETFGKVEAAVSAKQSYETKQIKQIFHELLSGKWKTLEEVKDPEMRELFALRDAEGKPDREAVVQATEAKRAPLAAAIKTAFVPVTHTIKITAE